MGLISFDDIGAFFGKIFTSKWFWIAFATVAVSIAGYYAFHKYVDGRVETAVVDDRKDATIATYQTEAKVNEQVAPIDRQYEAIRHQTQQDYHNVQVRIETASTEQREATTPDLIIDTLNDLSRMRQTGDPDPVLEAAGPVG